MPADTCGTVLKRRRWFSNMELVDILYGISRYPPQPFRGANQATTDF